MQLARETVADAVCRELQRRIDTGALAPGARINEVHMAAELGVSRTPLREALQRLVATHSLVAKPRIGFSVPTLSTEEFLSVYKIRPILDCAALEMAGLPPSERIDALDAINRKLRQTQGVTERIDLDDQWHLLLVAGCKNPVLIQLIKDMMDRTRRYEVGYLSSVTATGLATDEHLIVSGALRAGDLNAAVDGLKQNLTSGLEPLMMWLETKLSQERKRHGL